METFYLIDFENVHNDGIANIESMTKEDHVHIFSTQNATNIRQDIFGLEEDNFPVLKELCQKLYEQGKLIIAAENNNDIYSAPSIFDEVVSVKRIKLRHILIYDCKKNRIFISGKKWLRFHNESYTRTQNSNSYACAFASCVISRKDKKE